MSISTLLKQYFGDEHTAYNTRIRILSRFVNPDFKFNDSKYNSTQIAAANGILDEIRMEYNL